MPTQSIASVEAQISSLTSDITAFNNQIADTKSALDVQRTKLPPIKSKMDLAYQRYVYCKSKAQKAGTGNKQKDKECYDNPFLFPTSGGCYNKTHWNAQWDHFSSEYNKFLKQYNDQKAVISGLSSKLSDLKGSRDDKTIERDLAIKAKNALMKAEDDSKTAAATAAAIQDPEIVKATLEAEKANKEAKLASNRKLFIYGMITLAVVAVAFIAARALK